MRRRVKTNTNQNEKKKKKNEQTKTKNKNNIVNENRERSETWSTTESKTKHFRHELDVRCVRCAHICYDIMRGARLKAFTFNTSTFCL